MPIIPVVTVEVEDTNTAKQQKLLAMLNDKLVKTEVNKRILDAVNYFVPKRSGALRKSGRANSEFIMWGEGLEYGRYQYNGQIYGPNYPIIKGRKIVGWYSRPGRRKYPTGRMMSGYTAGNELLGYPFGYSEPGTGHHWDARYRKSLRWKAKTNREITNYLKQECKKRGLKA